MTIVWTLIIALFVFGGTFLIGEWLSDANRKIKWDLEFLEEETPRRLVEDDEATP